jgi:hypothetical protein
MWQGAVGVAPVDRLVSPDYTVPEATDELRPEYARQLFRTEAFSAECGRNSQGITWDRLRLNWDGFRDIFIPLPPYPRLWRITSGARSHCPSRASRRRKWTHATLRPRDRFMSRIVRPTSEQFDVDGKTL